MRFFSSLIAKICMLIVLLAFAIGIIWLIRMEVSDHPSTIKRHEDGSIVVMLDPGHGGTDPGAVVGEVYEKDINLSVSLLVKEILEQSDGMTVIMTRTMDVYPTLEERAEQANTQDVDFFVSIHSNALENNTTYTGINTYYHPSKPSDQTIAQTVQASIVAATGGIDRGAKSEDYYVIGQTEMPAVLVEMGYMTSPAELELLLDAGYQQELAQGIAEGILACIES